MDTAELADIPVSKEMRDYLVILVTQALKEYQGTQELQLQDIAAFQDTAVLMAYLVIAESKGSLDSLVLAVTLGTQEWMVRLVIAESRVYQDIPEVKDYRVILEFTAHLDTQELEETMEMMETQAIQDFQVILESSEPRDTLAQTVCQAIQVQKVSVDIQDLRVSQDTPGMKVYQATLVYPGTRASVELVVTPDRKQLQVIQVSLDILDNMVLPVTQATKE